MLVYKARVSGLLCHTGRGEALRPGLCAIDENTAILWGGFIKRLRCGALRKNEMRTGGFRYFVVSLVTSSRDCNAGINPLRSKAEESNEKKKIRTGVSGTSGDSPCSIPGGLQWV